MTYVASFAISLGPIFWLLNAEIYPLAVRSKAAGLGTMANWTFNFIVSLTFLLLIEALGRSGAFWFYGGDRHPHPLASAGSSCRRRRASTSRTSRPTSRTRVASRPGAADLSREPLRYPAADADRRDHRRAAADLLGRVLPAEDGGGDRAAVRDGARAARSWSPTSSRSPTAPAARPATARSRSPRR